MGAADRARRSGGDGAKTCDRNWAMDDSLQLLNWLELEVITNTICHQSITDQCPGCASSLLVEDASCMRRGLRSFVACRACRRREGDGQRMMKSVYSSYS